MLRSRETSYISYIQAKMPRSWTFRLLYIDSVYHASFWLSEHKYGELPKSAIEHPRTNEQKEIGAFDIDQLAVEIDELRLLYRWHFDPMHDSGVSDIETAQRV
jgi:hypothetical protein